MSTKLFIGNLSFNTMDDNLRQAFSEFGGVTSASVVLDRMSGQSRGFGFVEYDSPEDAQRAIEAMNGAVLDGRQLNVNEARERSPRPGGGGGGGRGGGGGSRRNRDDRW
jgi:RNA recognition motif-containing protein